jgi:hypothetical protein
MNSVGLFSFLVKIGVEKGQYSMQQLNPLYLFNINRIYIQSLILSPIPSYACVAKDFARMLLEKISNKISLKQENIQEEFERTLSKKQTKTRIDDVIGTVFTI